jgi:hypothetical protein
MKIQFNQFAPNPSLRGTTKHVDNFSGKKLIEEGIAVEVPLPCRGSAEWLAARKQQSETLNPTPVAVVKWNISKGEINGRYFISGRCSVGNCTTFNFDNDPDSLSFPGTRNHMALEHLTFLHSCGCGNPERVPSAICERYRKLWKPVTVIAKDEAIFHRACQPHPSDGKLVDRSTFAGPRVGQRPVAGNDNLADFFPTPLIIPEPLKLPGK